MRRFGIRVALVEPSFTKTSLDLNAPQAALRIATYDSERATVSQAIQMNVQKAPLPDAVAATIVEAALGAWKMRHTPKGEGHPAQTPAPLYAGRPSRLGPAQDLRPRLIHLFTYETTPCTENTAHVSSLPAWASSALYAVAARRYGRACRPGHSGLDCSSPSAVSKARLAAAVEIFAQVYA